MNKQPKLSVITPVYNGEKFISRCYQNLFSQTYNDWEWVIVDDGSVDGTKRIINEIDDDRIRLISYGPNKGRGFARHMACKESKGDWIVVWDIDDLHFLDRLEKIDEARVKGYDFFCSYATVVDNQLNIKDVRGFSKISSFLPHTFVHPTMACKTSIAKTIGYNPKIRTGEDLKIQWALPIQYKGMYFHDALSIYFEDREIFLQKSIDCNLGHIIQIKEMYNQKLIYNFDFVYLFIRSYLKVIILNIMRIRPSMYLKLVKYRDYGEKETGWCLSEDRLDFIRKMKKYL